MMKRFYPSALAVLVTLVIGLGFALPAFAQVDWGKDVVQRFLSLPEKDPRIIIAELINVFIGFLAIIFVILIISAGFKFMISGGDKEKTDKAKRAIANAIIGLAIVLSAWTITTFSIDVIINAINAS